METCVLSEEKGLNLAVQLLKEEKIVALPTETVYGLAGDAFSPRALVSIFEAKERPLSDPLRPLPTWLPAAGAPHAPLHHRRSTRREDGGGAAAPPGARAPPMHSFQRPQGPPLLLLLFR